MRSTRLFCLLLVLVGCDNTPTPTDSGVSPDSGMADAGPAVDCSGRPAEAPEMRGEVNGVYDEANGRILVYGGDTAAPIDCMPRYNLVDELWAFHLDCNSWERITTTGGPGVRARHATTLDTQRNRMLFFGGRTREGFGSYTNYNDVWALDLATDTWEQITTMGDGPSVRSSAVIAYDAAGDRMIVMGGNTSTSGLTLTGIGDTWSLDLATGAWTEITAAGGPAPRLYHGGVVVGTELLVYGGTPNFDGPFYADTLALDLATDTWRTVNDGVTGAVPASRFGAEVFADGDGRMVMAMGHDFGPPSGLGNMNDVWALDVAAGTWTQLQVGDALTNNAAGFCDFPADFSTPQDGSPERRYSFVHVQDATRAWVFGGKTDCGNINDVWELTLGTGDWERRRTSTGGEACNRTGRTGCATLCF